MSFESAGSQLLPVLPELVLARGALVLLMLSGGAALGAFATVWVATRRVTDERHRLRLDRLVT